MEEPPTPAAEPTELSFSSGYTSNFPELLRALKISLLVTTYQAGKLIAVRAEGDALNTHFRTFPSPMGLAYHRPTGRLGLGTRGEVWEFQNQPETAAKLEPQGRHDAAFFPRTRHYSGDIRIHEIAWVDNELWAVNTRFSCLCTFDRHHSFVPRWQPRFITALAPEDRCHLNGLALAHGRPKYVTCLGLTDTAGGWRVNKANGGCLIDVDTHEVLLQGLSMPHSPRLYGKHFWILESGHGAISKADLATGQTEVVAKLPGFTRGLSFYGRFAFVGLSQVRESAIFSNLPLLEEVPERSCGVWVVDLTTGGIVAFLRFEGVVQEIFAVEVLPDITYPDLVHEPGKLLESSFILPSAAYAQVPEGVRVGNAGVA